MPAVKKDSKDKYMQMLTLPPDKLQYINDLIFHKNKITQAIKILQNDYGLYKDYEASTLRIYLHQYKKEFKEAWYQFNLDGSMHAVQPIPEELKEHIPKEVGDPKLVEWIPYGKVKVAITEAVTKFDSMQELERLYVLQASRLMKVAEYEAKLPTEVEEIKKSKRIVDVDGKKQVIEGEETIVKPLLNLHSAAKDEINVAKDILTKIISLQMDLGIRHKVEKPSQHLHIDLQPQQQQLLKDFENMKTITEVTTKALEMIKESRGMAIPEIDDESMNDN